KAVDKFLADEEGEAEAPAGDAGAGLLTILFTDLVGSTALTQRLGDAAAQELLRTHNTIVRERLREHGGTELKSMGDGFMASSPLRCGAAEPGASIDRRPRRLIGAPTAPPPPRCAIRPPRVPHVLRRHAESKQAMGFRRFTFRRRDEVRDEWDLACAALNRR